MKIRCTSSGIGVEAGSVWPVLQDTKSYWIAVICGVEKKVIKSTGLFAGAPKNGPAFELVTVTEIQLDLIPQKRPVGRPKTGKALTPAEKQARYRARQAEKMVTVTFNRAHLATLKTLLANAPESLSLPADELDSLAKAVFDAALK
ncbi:hypothetical protein [Aeromonas veronii]|uniref:hypothetical protein n=1 Tax=Aeromonas veronii TaxID=654 RepID=UPI0027DABE60|nr:hypothetical protein [Aeromonas veronii]WMJ06989.1 hypothetical protein RBH93_10700 [Aeromonas veronii]WMJ06998.1 hypothetical protein RBH93_10745 [Aeromonas veronii]